VFGQIVAGCVAREQRGKLKAHLEFNDQSTGGPMDLQLTGKHVLITGGSRGIGLACAREFLREGARVSLVGRTAAHLDNALAQMRADGHSMVRGHSADLSDASAALVMLDAAEAELGPVEILVNSAGAARRTPFDELQPQTWRDAMQAKFFTYINVMDPVIKRMGARGEGAIVNIVGMGGKVATPTHLAGGAANAALMLATAGLATAYGPRGVRVNAVNPSLTLTDRMAEGIAADARLRQLSEAEVLRDAQARMPLGRLAKPEDIANAVVFLSSPRAGYISGAIVSMDGATTPMVV
jgi:NAD(P)-dependent dehydrogenase (short-subunit alcohol dehydrogenase family)